MLELNTLIIIVLVLLVLDLIMLAGLKYKPEKKGMWWTLHPILCGAMGWFLYDLIRMIK